MTRSTFASLALLSLAASSVTAITTLNCTAVTSNKLRITPSDGSKFNKTYVNFVDNPSINPQSVAIVNAVPQQYTFQFCQYETGAESFMEVSPKEETRPVR